MKGFLKEFLKELQESNATGAVQVVRTLSGSVEQPELDGYADKEIFSVHGKGKLLWAEVYETFNNLPSQSNTQMNIQLFIDGKLQANVRTGFNINGPKLFIALASPERFLNLDGYSILPTRISSLGYGSQVNTFPCSATEQLVEGRSAASYQCYFPIAAYIPFKESVEIRVSNTFKKNSTTYANFDCGVGYLLDED